MNYYDIRIELTVQVDTPREIISIMTEMAATELECEGSDVEIVDMQPGQYGVDDLWEFVGIVKQKEPF